MRYGCLSAVVAAHIVFEASPKKYVTLLLFIADGHFEAPFLETLE